MADRRTFLRGLAALPLVGSAAAAAPVAPIGGSADARLAELADAYEALERRCNDHVAAHRHLTGAVGMAADRAFDVLSERFGPIEDEVASTPADGLAGLLAKARFLQVPSARDYHTADVALSLADDLLRIAGAFHA